MSRFWNFFVVAFMLVQTSCVPIQDVSEITSSKNQKVADMTTTLDNEVEGDDSAEREILDAIMDGDFPLQKSLFEKYPEMILWNNRIENWVCTAAMAKKPEIIRWLLDNGVDVNWCPKDAATALVLAIFACDDDEKMFETVEYLLTRGANPNLGRPLISALNCHRDTLKLPLLKLLVKYGANVNRMYDLNGDPNNLFSALDWASGKCADYLKSVGAKTAVELSGKIPQTKSNAVNSPADEVVDFFTQDIGPVNVKSLTEIVPDETPITIHVIPATKERKFVTLFTTGLSAKAMHVPDELQDCKHFEYAELFIQLPGDWKYDRLEDPQFSWPVHQLRWLGKYPHLNDTWLGAPMTVVSRDPVEPLAPGLKFDSLLLIPEKQFVNTAGRTVQLYRLIPLYPEERELELQQGIAALMRALDRVSTPFIVDLKRKNAAK